MEKAKLGIIVAVFAIAIVFSTNWLIRQTDEWRALMAPSKDAEMALTGPAVKAKKVQLAYTVPILVNEVPTGEPYADDAWDFDVPGWVTTIRRATMSDVKQVYYYIPERCLKCHEEEGPGPYFYGNEEFTEFKIFTTDDGLKLHSVTEKHDTPTLMYDYKDRHLKKVPFDIGAPYDVYMKNGS